jgi:hypothetical protein
MPNLGALIANENAVETLEPCRGMSQLNTLVASTNHIEELGDELQECRLLAKLSLSHNRIRKLGASSLAHCVILKELRLAHNQLKALPPTLSANENLRILDLSHNRFENWGDVAVLSSLRRLQQLSMRGCPLAEQPGYAATAVKMCPDLRALDGRKVGPGGWIDGERGEGAGIKAGVKRSIEVARGDDHGEEGGYTMSKQSEEKEEEEQEKEKQVVEQRDKKKTTTKTNPKSEVKKRSRKAAAVEEHGGEIDALDAEEGKEEAAAKASKKIRKRASEEASENGSEKESNSSEKASKVSGKLPKASGEVSEPVSIKSSTARRIEKSGASDPEAGEAGANAKQSKNRKMVANHREDEAAGAEGTSFLQEFVARSRGKVRGEKEENTQVEGGESSGDVAKASSGNKKTPRTGVVKIVQKVPGGARRAGAAFGREALMEASGFGGIGGGGADGEIGGGSWGWGGDDGGHSLDRGRQLSTAQPISGGGSGDNEGGAGAALLKKKGKHGNKVKTPLKTTRVRV